jgi:hypothetical protein
MLTRYQKTGKMTSKYLDAAQGESLVRAIDTVDLRVTRGRLGHHDAHSTCIIRKRR